MLRELDHKLKFLNLQSFNEYRSVYDVHDVLFKLKFKVCESGQTGSTGFIFTLIRLFPKQENSC